MNIRSLRIWNTYFSCLAVLVSLSGALADYEYKQLLEILTYGCRSLAAGPEVECLFPSVFFWRESALFFVSRLWQVN